MTEKFIDKNPSLETYWRAIILLGVNNASYKFALAKSLLEINTDKTLIKLEDLSLPFAKNISEHLLTNDKQSHSPSSKFLDACRKFNNKEIDEGTLKLETMKLGFENVIDAFHNVAQEEIPRFFDDSRRNNQGITLTDNFYKLLETNQKENFKYEVNSRWELWETAISMNINPKLLEIKSDFKSKKLFVIKDKLGRIDVTSSTDALNGYQKGKCFYCFNDFMSKFSNDY